MSSKTDLRRRRLGLVCLTFAAGMLLCGLTLLETRLRGLAFLLYWLACFLFTTAAIAIAILDVRALRNESRSLRSKIIKDTFGDLDYGNVAEEKKPDDGPHD